jgi:hypothetical protein
MVLIYSLVQAGFFDHVENRYVPAEFGHACTLAEKFVLIPDSVTPLFLLRLLGRAEYIAQEVSGETL